MSTDLWIALVALLICCAFLPGSVLVAVKCLIAFMALLIGGMQDRKVRPLLICIILFWGILIGGLKYLEREGVSNGISLGIMFAYLGAAWAVFAWWARCEKGESTKP